MGYRIDTLPLFPKLNLELNALLEDLTPDEWVAPTHFPSWTVKDIVAHLLDTSLRRLSSQRDGFRKPGGPAPATPSELIQRITQQADRWAEAASFLSPSLLKAMVARYQDELVEFFLTLDGEAWSPIPVGWAGEVRSQNWFDVAREYTERWHHQMQIREALGRPSLMTPELSFPVFDTFLCALPYHYRAVSRPDGHVLEVRVEGESGGAWFLEWDGQDRVLHRQHSGRVDSRVSVHQAMAWKIFTRFDPTLATEWSLVEGDPELGAHLLQMKCIMME